MESPPFANIFLNYSIVADHVKSKEQLCHQNVKNGQLCGASSHFVLDAARAFALI